MVQGYMEPPYSRGIDDSEEKSRPVGVGISMSAEKELRRNSASEHVSTW